jgi:2-polyprenyl-3-methyl-5-hydroxy-6-metoxy-1,4-benzoquinol methylase
MSALAPRLDESHYERGVREMEADRRGAIEVPPCLVCTASRSSPRLAISGFAAEVVVCTGCGTGRLHPLPTMEQVRALYPPSYYGNLGAKFRGPIESVVRWVGSRHARFLASGLERGARVLDVGCGRGVLLSELAARGFEAHGVELRPEAAHGADPRARIRIVAELAAARYPDAWFDAVIVWHVLEHLRDPAATLGEIQRVLRPGGRLVVAVPNFSSLQARWAGAAWFHLDLPRHLYHFPLSALRRLLERNGFEVRSEHHFSLRQNPFGWIQSFQNRWPDLPRNGLYRLLYQRSPGEEPPAARPVRAALWAMLLFGAAPALAAALVETLLRSGATVHLVCRRR